MRCALAAFDIWGSYILRATRQCGSAKRPTERRKSPYVCVFAVIKHGTAGMWLGVFTCAARLLCVHICQLHINSADETTISIGK